MIKRSWHTRPTTSLKQGVDEICQTEGKEGKEVMYGFGNSVGHEGQE